MEFATRLASKNVAKRYPLNVNGPADWNQHPNSGKWQCTLALPEIPAEQILIPSFASTDMSLAGGQFQFSLHWTSENGESRHSTLNPVPASVPPAAPSTGTKEPLTPGATAHIDCWHTQANLQHAYVIISLTQTKAPEEYLLCVSTRPLQHSTEADTLKLSTDFSYHLEIPATLSQMEAADNLKHRICSPTALAMALSVFPQAPEWQSTVEACYDPHTKAYGAWPLAIRWAAQHGILGAVEAVDRWQVAVDLLTKGAPLVCSIRFEQGGLPGAPLKQTSGHLVLLHGIDAEHVLVKDPAGTNAACVDRRYPLKEFAAAWLQRRGAAYIFCLTS